MAPIDTPHVGMGRKVFSNEKYLPITEKCLYAWKYLSM